jgi:hypothetical protein
MSDIGDCRSGLKVPAPGAVNVLDNSAIMFMFYFDALRYDEKSVFDSCNIWLGGLQVVRNGEVTKGWELIERNLIDADRFIIKIRYRGSLPPVQMFCYGGVGEVKFCDHFFVKGARTSNGILLEKNLMHEPSAGFSKDVTRSLQTNKHDAQMCSIVGRDVFWNGSYFCTLSRSIDKDDVSNLKCHKHGSKMYFFAASKVLILGKNKLNILPMEPGYSTEISSSRIDFIYKNKSKTKHMYKDKELESIDKSADVLESDVAECYSIMPDGVCTKVRDRVKIVYDKKSLIIQRSFNPIRSDSDDILWNVSDITSEKNTKVHQAIESVSFADCDKLLVKITGGKKFLVGIHAPDTEAV